jgi:hypothetical protein
MGDHGLPGLAMGAVFAAIDICAREHPVWTTADVRNMP